MMQMNLELGRALRDAGIESTTDANADFMAAALGVCLRMRAAGGLVTGEEIRAAVVKAGHVPRAPQAWGALTNTLAVRGILRDTGRVVQMRDKRSHARRTPVWEWCRDGV